MTESPIIDRVRMLVQPIASDLQLDLYDIEMRGGTLRVVIDTQPGSERGVDLDQLALVTRTISREFDHNDPMPGSYTLEVSSPGVERTLRSPAHFQREIGKLIAVRLSDVEADQRRLRGVLVAADDTTATLHLEAANGEPIEGDVTDVDLRTIEIDQIDRAHTVFEWGPQPKPGKSKKKSKKRNKRETS